MPLMLTTHTPGALVVATVGPDGGAPAYHTLDNGGTVGVLDCRTVNALPAQVDAFRAALAEYRQQTGGADSDREAIRRACKAAGIPSPVRGPVASGRRRVCVHLDLEVIAWAESHGGLTACVNRAVRGEMATG